MTMAGFPPPPASRWQFGHWQEPPVNRWAFSHLREIVRTARVAASRNPRDLTVGSQVDPGQPVLSGDQWASLSGVLDQTYTDGFLLLHQGQVVVEQYPALTGASDTHALMSVSKSMVGCIVGILVDQRLIDLDSSVTTYIPEFAGSGYDGATVRQLLDMRSGIRFSEAYELPDAGVRVIEEVIDWAPRLHPGLPTSLYDYLTLLVAGSAHGGPFNYRSCETDVLGWVCERASNRRMPDLLSDLLWKPIGAEYDADAAVDGAGTVMHDGGLAATLRDLGRFGQMLLDNGSVNGEQVVPAWWIEDALTGAADSRAAFAASSTDTRMPGGMYRNQFWLQHADQRVLMCLGIYGQLIYIDYDHDVVAVKLSSWPYPQHADMLLNTLAAVATTAAQLAERQAAPVAG